MGPGGEKGGEGAWSESGRGGGGILASVQERGGRGHWLGQPQQNMSVDVR